MEIHLLFVCFAKKASANTRGLGYNIKQRAMAHLLCSICVTIDRKSFWGIVYEKDRYDSLVCIFAFTLAGCAPKNNKYEGKAETPSGSTILKGTDYQAVINTFSQKGFTNIKSEPIEDLITGWLTKDGEVEEVSVGGDVEYSPNKWLAADTPVIIKYHTFAQQTSENSTEPVTTAASEATSAPIATTVPVQTTADASSMEKPSQEILTADNCEELAAILSTKDDFSPIIKEFVIKYAGRIIEVDGNTADIARHDNYNTRFDYLILAGDYSETTFSGPNFQLSDVNYQDLHLTGENVPDTFGEKLNIRLTAEVGKYNESSGLFQLKPISIKMR